MTAQKPSIGVLLVNLGTPKSFQIQDVNRYLLEFLLDPRVIDYPWIFRQLLVRGIIVPLRLRNSARTYQSIWMQEGSPLLVYGRRVEKLLQERLGLDYQVVLAMRYQEPSIKEELRRLRDSGVRKIIVLPLFPQYASATTGSVHETVMKEMSTWHTIPSLELISSYADHPKFIQAFAENARRKDLSKYEHFLISFHGLPERQLLKADYSKTCCLKRHNCCDTVSSTNNLCYRHQCILTAQSLIRELDLDSTRTTISFQSRLGKEEWLKPYTNETIKELAQKGIKRLLVFCPSFVADCLETLYEIGEEYKQEFLDHGGESLDFVESLNDQLLWIEGLQEMILDRSI